LIGASFALLAMAVLSRRRYGKLFKQVLAHLVQ
jgi:hypothetical protein